MAGKERTLEATSTWAVAVVCFVLVAISIVIEQIIHHSGSWLKKRKKAPLYEALEKIKAELMLLGFISLLLTVGQDTLSNICVPRSVGHSWHPCRNSNKDDSGYDDPCLQKGKIQVVSTYGIHQLHIFIFVLALSHVLYCVVTYGLGKLKMRKWKSWEDETKTIQYQYYNDPERFRFARDTSFGRRHLHFWSRSPVLLWMVCFFRQFLTSVAKVDYLTLRRGFITEHLTPQSHTSFNFHKYINRSLEEDVKVIVGISPLIWFCAVLLLLTNTNGLYSYFWLPFIPLIIILLVGAKLQVIITKMGRRILEKGDVIRGSPLVQPSDDLFWFRRPRFILFLIHFILFENAFQLAFFAWSWYEFGYPSCYHENLEDMIIRVAMGVLIQVLCSYVTLPLYALVTQVCNVCKVERTILRSPTAVVANRTKQKSLNSPNWSKNKCASHISNWAQETYSLLPLLDSEENKNHQMGSKMKPVIFSDQVASALRKWHQTAKKHLKQGRPSANSTPSSSRPASPLHSTMSPVYLLHGHRKNIKEGGYQTSPRASDFTNEGSSGGGEGTSASPSHHDFDDFKRKDRLPEASAIEIDREIEGPSFLELSNRGQHVVHDSLNEFSFRKKDMEAEGAGLK